MSSSSEQKILRVGTVIAGKYRIDKAIARGGFSVIYRATHIEMKRPVGLKIPTIAEDIKASWLERFTREARLASQLTHPNTVTIYDYGQDPHGFLYIAMEWVEGVSLYQYLDKRGALPPLAVARLSVQILASLQEAHQLHFLHRDLKPSNIMLTRDFQGQDMVKILDFGIAKDLSENAESLARITHQGTFVGTPRYASPEQLEQTKQLGPPSDIYSLGLLMWEAMVGDPAVPSTIYGECVEKHLGPEPWVLPPAVSCPPGLERILYKALAKPTVDRYQTCAEMRRELLAWLNTPEARAEDAEDVPFSRRRSPSPPPLRQKNSPVDQLLQAAKQARPKPAPRAEEDLPPLELDLARIADDGRNNRAGHPAQARAPGEYRPAEPRAPRANLWPRIAAASGAALLIALLGWWAFSDDNSADAPAPPEPSQASALAEPHEKPAPPRPAPRDPAAASVSPSLVWAAIQESGWKRIGKLSSFDAGGLTQENGRFRKSGHTVAVTVFSANDHGEMPDYSEVAEPPAQVIDFGTTFVQVAPGTPSTTVEAIDHLAGSLRKLQEIIEEQREDAAP
ncbi:serine/threonine protein kinase [Bradymonas sediminis]|nr:serine/threonine-protein kinase [Bradymonas sediminis]